MQITIDVYIRKRLYIKKKKSKNISKNSEILKKGGLE